MCEYIQYVEKTVEELDKEVDYEMDDEVCSPIVFCTRLWYLMRILTGLRVVENKKRRKTNGQTATRI